LHHFHNGLAFRDVLRVHRTYPFAALEALCCIGRLVSSTLLCVAQSS
jgi:hypothetical protein